MKILSFDVSGNYSSISLLNDDEANTFTQSHGRKDRPDWDKLFASIGFDSKEGFNNLDALAFACGPGSYTALRITASFLKAIAEVKKLPLLAISNLESIANEALHWVDEEQSSVLVAIEADSKESYFCSYKKNKDQLVSTQKESVVGVDVLLELLDKKDCYFAGTGWPQATENHSNFLSSAIGSAESIALLAKKKLETHENFLPENANPVYLKTPEYNKT